MFEESPVVDHGGPGLLDATWEIAIMLLVAGILGYLIRWAVGLARTKKLHAEVDALNSAKLKMAGDLEENEKSLATSKSSVQQMTTERNRFRSSLDDCNRKYKKLEADFEEYKATQLSVKQEIQEVEQEEESSDSLLGFVSGSLASKEEEASSKQEFVAGPKPDVIDDLKKIEGVGPKIQEHLNNGGIWTFAQLAEARVSYLQKILDAAGPAYTIHDPGTWPEQSVLCQRGEWDKLEKWQNELKGGKRR
jgi:predicted flap endonuclease-1-like 5' DNA nuclease